MVLPMKYNLLKSCMCMALPKSLILVASMTNDRYKLLFDSDQVHVLENFELLDDACIAAIGSRDKNYGLYFLHSPKDDFINVS